jgi:hypothetical protein
MRSRERMTGLVRAEVRSQLKQLGVASRDEVEALRKRVRELEKAGSTKRKTPAKRRASPKPRAAAPVKAEVDVVEIPVVEPEVEVVVATELTSIPVDGPIPEAEGPGPLPS